MWTWVEKPIRYTNRINFTKIPVHNPKKNTAKERIDDWKPDNPSRL